MIGWVFLQICRLFFGLAILLAIAVCLPFIIIIAVLAAIAAPFIAVL